MKSKRGVWVVLAAMGLTGCVSTQNMAGVSAVIDASAKEAASQSRATQAALLDSPVAAGRESARVWLPVKAVPLTRRADIPEQMKRKITLVRTFNSIQEVAERIISLEGVPVVIAADVTQPATTSGVGQAAPTASGMALPSTPSSMPLPGVSALTTGQTFMPSALPGATVPPFAVNYEGSLSGFMDLVAAKYGVSWRYTNQRIEIFRMTTRTFVIKTLPGAVTNAATVAGVTNGSGGGTSSQSVGVTSSLDIWADIRSALTSMASTGGRSSVNTSTGTVVVTDTPATLDRIGEYIDQQNAIMSRQVALNVSILSVSRNNQDAAGINWTAVFNNLSQNFGMRLATQFSAPQAAASLTMGILQSAGQANPGADIGQIRGSQAVASALTHEGKVRQIYSWTGVTLNNRPAPISVGREYAYIASTSAVATANAGVTTTITPGQFMTGLSMSLLPNITNTGEVMLQSTVDLSVLAGMFSAQSGTSTVQQPQIDSRRMIQQARLRSGQTLVLTGFERNSDDVADDSTGILPGKALGGMATSNRNRDTLVVIITPVVVDNP